jgi:SnoaL-like domain
MRLFADIDTMQPDAFARYLAEDCTMRFGNAPPLHGREACREAWASLCELVDGVHHDVVHTWEIDDATIAETEVTYTRTDGCLVTVPVVTTFARVVGSRCSPRRPDGPFPGDGGAWSGRSRPSRSTPPNDEMDAARAKAATSTRTTTSLLLCGGVTTSAVPKRFPNRTQAATTGWP